MITWDEVLQYIRDNLSLPSGFIEKTDDEIRKYLISNALREFSRYFPDWEYTKIDTNDPELKHPTIKNRWKIVDNLGLDIFGIRDCIFDLTNSMVTGHPVIGPFSLGELRTWALDVYESNLLAPYTMFNYTYNFIPPNWIELITDTSPPKIFVVQYERMQPLDLSKIAPALYQKFKEFCLAYIKIWIGELRSKYGDNRLSTPFGEIPLNGADLKQEGLQEKARLVDEFEDAIVPPVIIISQ